MPLVTTSRRPSSAARSLRRARTRDALARIPSEFLRGTNPEAVMARAAAFGYEPGKVYGRNRFTPPLGTQPYVGELMLFGGNYAPNGWLNCQGQLLPISENETLFQLIGTTYGGDGEETFALPNLASRLPMHMGTGPDGTTYQVGEAAGVETVTLTVNQIPAHTHNFLYTTNAGTQASPVNAFPAAVPAAGKARYAPTSPASMKIGQLSSTGGSQPHDNMSPFLVVTICISLFGLFPQQS